MIDVPHYPDGKDKGTRYTRVAVFWAHVNGQRNDGADEAESRHDE